MKIAFLHHSFILGSGIDSLIYQWAKKLGARHEVHIYTCKSDYRDDNFRIHIHSDVISRTKTGSAVFAGMSGEWHGKVRKELEQMDVVVTQLYPATVMLPKLKHPKWVHIEWSVPPMNFWDNLQGKLYSRLLRWGNGVGCRKADLVLTPSHFVHDWVKKEFGVESKVMYLDGIDFELFDRTKYENRFDTNEILYVGRIAPHKNLETLIRAFALVKKEIPDATLTLAGSKAFEKYYWKLENLVTELAAFPNVHFVGTVPWGRLPQYYADCALWCSPTKWEGFLKSEAYAFGKPMVALDYTSNREMVLDNQTGLIAVPKDMPSVDKFGKLIAYVSQTQSEVLAEVLISLLKNKDKALRFGENGYKWARENLDIGEIVTNLERVFQEVVNG